VTGMRYQEISRTEGTRICCARCSEMPLYYFDTQNGEVLVEDELFELADIDAAKAEAIRYLWEAAPDHLKANAGDHSLVCTVKDEGKHALLSIKLILEIE
jgi:hypothetical protein